MVLAHLFSSDLTSSWLVIFAFNKISVVSRIVLLNDKYNDQNVMMASCMSLNSIYSRLVASRSIGWYSRIRSNLEFFSKESGRWKSSTNRQFN
jgi:hypothetical protein